MSRLHHACVNRVDVSLEGTRTAVPKYAHRVEVDESLVNFSVNFAILFHSLLVYLLPKEIFLLTGLLRTGRTQESTSTTS